MVSPIGPTGVFSESIRQSPDVTIKANSGFSLTTTVQSANVLPSIPPNYFLKGVKFIWKCIARFCIVLCGIFIASKGVATGDSTSNNAFLIWLNQSKHHFRHGIRQISKDYQESLKHKNPRQEFFNRVDEHKNKRSITGQNAYHLKQNFSMPNIGSGPVNHDILIHF